MVLQITAVLHRRFDPDRVSRAIDDGDVTLVSLVPDMPDLQVHRRNAHGGTGSWTQLSDCSHIVKGIGADFVNVVKKIRLFVDPGAAATLAPQRAAVEAAITEQVLAA